MNSTDALLPSSPAGSSTPSALGASSQALGARNPLFDADRPRALAAAAELLRTGDLAPLREIFDGNVSMELRKAVLGLFASTPGEAAGELLWWVLLRKPRLSQTRNAALAALADRHGLTELAAQLRRHDASVWFVTSRGLRVLGQIGDRRGVRLLRDALVKEELSEEDIPHLIAALRTLGGEEAIDALVRCLDDASVDVRQEAREALVALGPTSIPRLLAAIEGDEDERVHWEAARTLARFGDARAVPVLADSLSRRFDLAVRELVQLGPAGLTELCNRSFNDGEDEEIVRQIVARGQALRPALTRLARRPPRSELAQKALARLPRA